MKDEIKQHGEIKQSKRGGYRPGAGRKPKHISDQPSEKLTMKQRKFIAGKLQGKSNHAAAVDAGYSEQTAVAAGRNVLSSPMVQSEFQRLLKKVVPDEFLVGKIRAGLMATKKTYVVSEGSITAERRDPDYATQHKFVDTVCKLQQLIAPPQEAPAPVVQVALVWGSNPEWLQPKRQ